MQRICQRLQNTDVPTKWLFYGDSITHGCTHTMGQRDYVELFAERVRGELGRFQDLILNAAISGNTTRQLLDDYDWRVGQFAPDVVFLMIGMNDCSSNNDLSLDVFKANLQTLADRLQNDNAQLVLQTTCPILPGSTPEREPHFPAYMDAIRELAASAHLPLIDHTRLWPADLDALYYWMNNAFHPNEYGHRAFAFELFRALNIFDATSPTCRLFLP